MRFDEEKDRFIKSLKYNSEDRKKITQITEGQSQNLEWYSQRIGSLTASNFGPILRFMSVSGRKPDGLIKRIQNYRQRGMTCVPRTYVPALKWGLKCESVACKSYEAIITGQHKQVKVMPSGLCVCDSDLYLRASPDAIVSCVCHQYHWLLEIKCPWSVRNIDPADAVDSGATKYVRKTDGVYSLIPGAACGYYEQVQGTMAVCGLSRCDFVIWTMRGVLVIPVEFDSVFWDDAKCQLRKFCECYVVTEILTERVWRTLPLFDEDDIEPVAVSVDDSADLDFVQEFDDDIVLDDDRHEEYCLSSGLQERENTSSKETLSCDDDDANYCSAQQFFFDFNDFEDEETVSVTSLDS